LAIAGARRQVIQPAQVFERLDPRRGDHPPIADEGQPGQLEPVANDLDGRDERRRIGGVTGNTRIATGRPSGSVSSPYSI
jgi:hypothetical protein